MNTIIQWVAEQEAFLFKGISMDKIQLVLGYTIIVSLFIFLTKKTFKRTAFLLGCVVCFQGWSIYKNYTLNQQESLLVFHKKRNTVLVHRIGQELTVLSTHQNNIEKILSDYTNAESITSKSYKTIKNSYRFKNRTLTIVDSTSVYPKTKLDVIVLTQSTKINLERLIDTTNPKLIIVDGSNYKSAIAHWKATCAHKKIPFHYTGEKGFYEFY